MTKHIKLGAQNTITVLADNSFSKTTIPYSISFDWPNDGGIIRSVSMLATNPLYIEQVHVNTKPDFSNVEKPSGTATIKVKLAGLGNIDKKQLTYRVTMAEENQSTSTVIYNKYHH